MSFKVLAATAFFVALFVTSADAASRVAAWRHPKSLRPRVADFTMDITLSRSTDCVVVDPDTGVEFQLGNVSTADQAIPGVLHRTHSAQTYLWAFGACHKVDAEHGHQAAGNSSSCTAVGGAGYVQQFTPDPSAPSCVASYFAAAANASGEWAVLSRSNASSGNTSSAPGNNSSSVLDAVATRRFFGADGKLAEVRLICGPSLELADDSENEAVATTLPDGTAFIRLTFRTPAMCHYAPPATSAPTSAPEPSSGNETGTPVPPTPPPTVNNRWYQYITRLFPFLGGVPMTTFDVCFDEFNGAGGCYSALDANGVGTATAHQFAPVNSRCYVQEQQVCAQHIPWGPNEDCDFYSVCWPNAFNCINAWTFAAGNLPNGCNRFLRCAQTQTAMDTAFEACVNGMTGQVCNATASCAFTYFRNSTPTWSTTGDGNLLGTSVPAIVGVFLAVIVVVLGTSTCLLYVKHRRWRRLQDEQMQDIVVDVAPPVRWFGLRASQASSEPADEDERDGAAVQGEASSCSICRSSMADVAPDAPRLLLLPCRCEWCGCTPHQKHPTRRSPSEAGYKKADPEVAGDNKPESIFGGVTASALSSYGATTHAAIVPHPRKPPPPRLPDGKVDRSPEAIAEAAKNVRRTFGCRRCGVPVEAVVDLHALFVDVEAVEGSRSPAAADDAEIVVNVPPLPAAPPEAEAESSTPSSPPAVAPPRRRRHAADVDSDREGSEAADPVEPVAQKEPSSSASSPSPSVHGGSDADAAPVVTAEDSGPAVAVSATAEPTPRAAVAISEDSPVAEADAAVPTPRGDHTPKSARSHTNGSDAPDCCVCLSEPSCVVSLPCGHLGACADCAKRLAPAVPRRGDDGIEVSSKCPLCRARVEAMAVLDEPQTVAAVRAAVAAAAQRRRNE